MLANNPRIILLDLQHKYQHFHDMFNAQVFRRFTDRTQCSEYVASYPINQRPLHCFIPDSEHTIISNDVHLSSTIYYIYCANQGQIHEMNQLYPISMSVKIFHVNCLVINLFGAMTQHWIDQANRTYHESDEHDRALEEGSRSANALAKKLHEQVVFKTSYMSNDT